MIAISVEDMCGLSLVKELSQSSTSASIPLLNLLRIFVCLLTSSSPSHFLTIPIFFSRSLVLELLSLLNLAIAFLLFSG